LLKTNFFKGLFVRRLILLPSKNFVALSFGSGYKLIFSKKAYNILQNNTTMAIMDSITKKIEELFKK